ncbi:MAG: hypothetical protein IKT66_03980 [Alistipes sp.]|nr:hypothetical protein [Alistipes sp.]
MKVQKFVSEPSCDHKGYVIARFNETRGQYEALHMTPGQQELITRLVRELNLEYEEDCKIFIKE